MAIQIITDSACDLPKDLIEEHNIDVLPFLIHIDDEEYVDGQTIHPQEVYQAIKEGKQPQTSQVTANRFFKTFISYAEKGISCIYLAFSGKLSGTCNTARLVAEDVKKRYPNFDITVCDTHSGSLGQGLICYEAANMVRAGKSREEIISTITARSQNNVEHLFTVDDLDHLHRGGRLSYAGAIVGGLLKIKPILHVKDGLIKPIQKVRGKNAALRKIVTLMQESALGDKEQLVAISHTHDPTSARKLQEIIKESLGYTNFITNMVGSVLGCHIGLGGVAAFFVNKRGTLYPIEPTKQTGGDHY